MREGSYESSLLARQASKDDASQESIATVLDPLDVDVVDVLVVGVGPAGLALAAELAKRGLKTGLVGPDGPLVNTYGVWQDEFVELGLAHTLDKVWKTSS